MGAFLVTFSLLGLLIGTLGGILSRLIHWHPAKSFVASLAATVLAPLRVFVPTAAGFTAGRRLTTLFFRNRD